MMTEEQTTPTPNQADHVLTPQRRRPIIPADSIESLLAVAQKAIDDFPEDREHIRDWIADFAGVKIRTESFDVDLAAAETRLPDQLADQAMERQGHGLQHIGRRPHVDAENQIKALHEQRYEDCIALKSLPGAIAKMTEQVVRDRAKEAERQELIDEHNKKLGLLADMASNLQHVVQEVYDLRARIARITQLSFVSSAGLYKELSPQMVLGLGELVKSVRASQEAEATANRIRSGKPSERDELDQQRRVDHEYLRQLKAAIIKYKGTAAGKRTWGHWTNIFDNLTKANANLEVTDSGRQLHREQLDMAWGLVCLEACKFSGLKPRAELFTLLAHGNY